MGSSFKSTGLQSALGGCCTLITVMGVGRFAYTVLLPGMMLTHGLSAAEAGSLASWNLAGYLFGVLAMLKARPGTRRYVLFALFLLLSLASTAAMGLPGSLAWYTGLRCLGGVASGACFVLCSAIVLDTLHALALPLLSGILFSGVGLGIALGGIAARPLEKFYGPDSAWAGMALLCVPLAAYALFALRPGANTTPPQAWSKNATRKTTGNKGQFAVLLTTYGIEGFGYIIGATFLVALIQQTGAASFSGRAELSSLAATAWILTGFSAAFSPLMWRHLARKGYTPVLMAAFILQAVGVLLPALSSARPLILLGAALLGGTFMGITTLSLHYGVLMRDRPSAESVAILTGVYGVGQILGPAVAGISAQEQGFAFAFILSAASLFVATGLLAFAKRQQSPSHA